jgi:tRNA pseudouridine32 synthase/23S rRNA pseudouridine746 synthase
MPLEAGLLLPHVVYSDATIVVLHKPSGLLSVPGKTQDHCLSSLVQQAFADALLVHRLDMATSGLLVMARGLEAQRHLNASFAERRVHKRYVAVAHGDCRPLTTGSTDDWQAIDLPILVDWPNRPLRKIDTENGKPSSTRWRCLGYGAEHNASRLELEPLTGRSHQLRVHLQAIGHPILGDALYAPPDIAAVGGRLLLHASELAFAHPDTGAWTSFQLADDFAAWA